MTKIKLTKTAFDAGTFAAKDYELRDTVVPGFLLKGDARWPSIPTMHGGSFSARAINVSRLTLRRITTAPDVLRPTMLQTFLPRSIPRTEIAAKAIVLGGWSQFL
jgi:hypothetical protein